MISILSNVLKTILTRDNSQDYPDFVTDLNFMISKLTELTYRGSPGGDDSGPLADDNLVKSYLRSFKRMTTTPIPGFQNQTPIA